MIWAGVLAGGGFAAGAVVLFSVGPRGSALSAAALGLGLGGVASLEAGPVAFLCLAACGVGAALLLLLEPRLQGRSAGDLLLGGAETLGRPRVFGIRGLRAILGALGLFAARLLSGHLAAGTVNTQGPAFACLFVFEVGLIRIGTGRGPGDMALGGLCSGMAAAGFLMLSRPGTALPVAILAASLPALALAVLGRATPWEASS